MKIKSRSTAENGSTEKYREIFFLCIFFQNPYKIDKNKETTDANGQFCFVRRTVFDQKDSGCINSCRLCDYISQQKEEQHSAPEKSSDGKWLWLKGFYGRGSHDRHQQERHKKPSCIICGIACDKQRITKRNDSKQEADKTQFFEKIPSFFLDKIGNYTTAGKQRKKQTERSKGAFLCSEQCLTLNGIRWQDKIFQQGKICPDIRIDKGISVKNGF